MVLLVLLKITRIHATRTAYIYDVSEKVKSLKVWTFAIALLIRVTLENSSILQSPKRRLIIGMN